MILFLKRKERILLKLLPLLVLILLSQAPRWNSSLYLTPLSTNTWKLGSISKTRVSFNFFLKNDHFKFVVRTNFVEEVRDSDGDKVVRSVSVFHQSFDGVQ